MGRIGLLVCATAISAACAGGRPIDSNGQAEPVDERGGRDATLGGDPSTFDPGESDSGVDSPEGNGADSPADLSGDIAEVIDSSDNGQTLLDDVLAEGTSDETDVQEITDVVVDSLSDVSDVDDALLLLDVAVDIEEEVDVSSTAYTASSLDLTIPDDAYDGSLGSMVCVSLDVPSTGYDAVEEVVVRVAVGHAYIGDLIIKITSPAETVVTLLSQPGVIETTDDGTNGVGDSSNLVITSPVIFDDSAAYDAEDMGSGLSSTGVICADDGRCAYFPNPGAGPGTNLADFRDENAVGTWNVCFGDSNGVDEGTVGSVLIDLTTRPASD